MGSIFNITFYLADDDDLIFVDMFLFASSSPLLFAH